MKKLLVLLLAGLALPSITLAAGHAQQPEPGPALEYLLKKIEVLQKENRDFELRDAIREAVDMAPQDERVLRGLAYVSDIFGDHAAEAYERWATALEHAGASAPDVREALARGFVVALRDGESASAGRISERLTRLGDTRFDPISARGSIEKKASQTVVPGGRRALGEILGLNPDLPSGRFALEYALAILRVGTMPSRDRDVFRKSLRLYFSTVKALQTFGTRGANGSVEIALDLRSEAGVGVASKVVGLLGWQIREGPNNLLIELSPDEDASIRQSFTSALGIDELEMKMALEEQQTFTLKLHDDRESLIFDDAFWIALLKQQGSASSFFEAALQNHKLPQLYVAFAGMNEETRRTLVILLGREDLLARTRELALYGSSIIIDAGRVVVPGGPEAAAAWSSLTREGPDHPGPFVRNLLRKDGGKLFAYYYAIATLPLRNQRFFTSTAHRLGSFYRAFPFEDRVSIDHNAFVRRDDPFVRLARELPFNEDGSIRFPGGARVWTVDQVDRSKAPAKDDEILLTMLGRTYSHGVLRINQIENFLAVAHIESHRREPLDDRTALTLSQLYPKYRAIFPYFAAMPALNGDAIDAFRHAAEQLEKFEGVSLNTALGEFHSLIQLSVIFNELGLLSDEDAAELFTSTCRRIASIQTPVEIGAAAFDAFERILEKSGRRQDESADEFFLRAVAGEIGSADFRETTIKRLREVLRLQSIGSMDPLLAVSRAASALMNGDAVSWKEVEENVARLTEIEEETGDNLSNTLRNSVIAGDPQDVSAIVAHLKRQLSARKPSKDVARTAARLIEKLNPLLKTTLVGWVYAYYFSPDDLAIASDRYLVRRHSFHDAVTGDYWPASRVSQYPGAMGGSYLAGGFAEVAAAAGMIGKTNVQARDSLELNNYVTTTSAQLAAVRSVPWRRVTDLGMHSVALKLRLARELVVRTAFDAMLLRELSDATTGLIGAHRRFELMDALTHRDFESALRLLSPGDLYFLADALGSVPEFKRLNSPVHTAFEASETEAFGQHQYFGGFHRVTLTCAHPHLVRLAPFEEYENQQLMEPLAERMSEILLALAEAADRDGMPAGALARLADPAIRRYSLRMAGYGPRDWMTAIDMMRSVDFKALNPVIERN